MGLELNFEKQTNRSCGSCSLCCRLLPQKEISKPALTRCEHQRHSSKGSCAIYKNRPLSCIMWSCAWLMRADTANLHRPDRSHVVVDTMPDVITMQPDDGPEFDMEVIVLWVDPAHKDAWRHPSILDYCNQRCIAALEQEKYLAVLIRYGSGDGFVAFPPALTGHHEWVTHGSEVNRKWTDRTSLEKLERLAAL